MTSIMTSWLHDVRATRQGLIAKKTGHPIPLTTGTLVDVGRWLRFYRELEQDAPSRPAPLKVCFYPDTARPWYFAWAIVRQYGAEIVTDPAKADLVWYFDDSTYIDPVDYALKAKPALTLNASCTDVSKSLIARVNEQVFGRALEVDPTTHQGPMVEKSQINGAHDGRIVMGPLQSKEGRVYQRVIDNRLTDDLVEDLRTTIMGSEPVLVFRKQRPTDKRFENSNANVLLAKLDDIFSAEEIRQIGQFAKTIGLNAGGLDVLRDRHSGEIYVVDANKTDMGPPLALPQADKMHATRIMADAFGHFIRSTPRQTKPIPRGNDEKMSIPYVKEIEFEYGRVDQLTPLIRRVIARNPGSFTYTGTGVYIIGHDEVAVIDPGPDMDEHFNAVKQALEGETVTHVLVTHSHMDHSPLSHPLARWAGCQVHAKGPAIPTDATTRVEAGDDLSFQPDIVIGDDWTCSGPGWTIEAIETPGHTSNHLCYMLREENALFSGDHIMGWSTSVVSPPDGHMGAYLDSLHKVRNRNFSVIYPSHGAPIKDDPNGFIDAYIDHRHQRENAILKAVSKGHHKIIDIVRHVYQDVDKKLHPAACHSVLAHMIYMHEQGRIQTKNGEATIDAEYQLPARPSKSA